MTNHADKKWSIDSVLIEKIREGGRPPDNASGIMVLDRAMVSLVVLRFGLADASSCFQ